MPQRRTHPGRPFDLHGHGIASQGGAFFVAPDAEDPRKPAPPDRVYVIARLSD